MLETLERSLTVAYDRASALAASKAPQAGDDRPFGLSASGLAVPDRFERFDLGQAAEQYRHYRGRVYSAIRVITQRISGQPVYVGRIVEPGRSNRSLKRLLDEGRIREAE